MTSSAFQKTHDLIGNFSWLKWLHQQFCLIQLDTKSVEYAWVNSWQPIWSQRLIIWTSWDNGLVDPYCQFLASKDPRRFLEHLQDAALQFPESMETHHSPTSTFAMWTHAPLPMHLPMLHDEWQHWSMTWKTSSDCKADKAFSFDQLIVAACKSYQIASQAWCWSWSPCLA